MPLFAHRPLCVTAWRGCLIAGKTICLSVLGGTRSPRPQLPLLLLGVDQMNLIEQRADQRSREFLRRHLRVPEQDVLVLWLGRLSFFEKAYPQGMFIALQKAVQRIGRRLHFVMADGFPVWRNRPKRLPGVGEAIRTGRAGAF